MPWYSYLFFLLAGLAFFLGAYNNAQRRNGVAFVYSLIMTVVWAFLGLRTGGFL